MSFTLIKRPYNFLQATFVFLSILLAIVIFQFIDPLETQAAGPVIDIPNIVIGGINVNLNLVDENGIPINPVQAPPALTANGDGTAHWCWSGTCHDGTDEEALGFVEYYLGLVVNEYGSTTNGATVLYDALGRVIYIACVNGGVVNVTYAGPPTNDVCPDDVGTQTNLSECSCTPTNPSCAASTCNTTTCYDGCVLKTGTMDCSAPQTASLSATPNSIAVGDSATLNYSCSPPSPASIIPNVGSLGTVGSGNVSDSPPSSTTYTLSCFGATTQSASAAVTVNASCVVYSGQACTSAANACSMTNSGTYDCSGICSASVPDNSACVTTTCADLGMVGTYPACSTPVVGSQCSATSGYSEDDCFGGSPSSLTGTMCSYGGTNGTWSCDAPVMTNETSYQNNANGGNGNYCMLREYSESCTCGASACAAPLPSATLEARVNGGAWTASDQTVNVGDTVTLRWSSTNAASCTGTNINTGGATSNAGTSVTIPAQGSYTDFGVTCGSATDTLRITTNVPALQANLTQPIVNYTTGTFNTVTGIYSSISIIFQTSNSGAGATGATAQYTVELDRQANGSYDDTKATSSIPPLGSGNSTGNISETFTNVSYGNLRTRVTVDTTNAITEANETDNQRILNFTLAPQNPSIDVSVDRIKIRNDETVTVSWNTGATYPMNCSVYGPGLAPVNFDPSINGATGSRVSQPITAKSIFTISCTEPITNTKFSDTVTVETTGKIEEV